MKKYVIYNIITGYYFDNDFVEAKIYDCRIFDTFEEAEEIALQYISSNIIYRIDAIYVKV